MCKYVIYIWAVQSVSTRPGHDRTPLEHTYAPCEFNYLSKPFSDLLQFFALREIIITKVNKYLKTVQCLASICNTFEFSLPKKIVLLFFVLFSFIIGYSFVFLRTLKTDYVIMAGYFEFIIFVNLFSIQIVKCFSKNCIYYDHQN